MNALPLKGMGILITRDKVQGKKMAKQIMEKGGTPLHVPLLAFREHISVDEQSYISKLATYSWIIFTSKNAISFFLNILERHHLSIDNIEAKVAVVGKKTEENARKRGISVDLIPDDFTAEGLVQHFLHKEFKVGNVLIPKGNLARDVIASSLLAEGYKCDEWVVYETYLPKESEKVLTSYLNEGSVDVVTFTSSSTVHHFMKVVHDNGFDEKLQDYLFACIGPIAKNTAIEYGLEVKICPKVYTVDDMIQELIRYYE